MSTDQLQMMLIVVGGGMSVISLILYLLINNIYDITNSLFPKNEKIRKRLYLPSREFAIKFGKIFYFLMFFVGLTIIFFAEYIAKHS